MMANLRYESARLRTAYYLLGIQVKYLRGKHLPPPSYVIWDCTRRCNLHCLHCGAAREEYACELTTGQIQGILDQLAGMKVAMFSVTGGEPLLRKDLPEVLVHASRLGLKTGIATNGFLIDEAAVQWIRSSGVHSVQVSLDGLERTHNRIRGNDHSFQRAVRALELLKRQRIPIVSVATTVSTNNLSEIPALRDLLLRLGIRLWRLGLVMPIGRAQASRMRLGMDQLSSLLEYVRAKRSRKLHIYIGENLTHLGDWERRIRNRPAICPVGFTACCIGVDGTLRGCPEQPDSPGNREGSLLVDPFPSLWQTGFRRYRTRTILSEDANCARCKVNEECFGGCWVMRTAGQQCIYELVGSQPPPGSRRMR